MAEQLKPCPFCGSRAENRCLIKIPGYTRYTVTCFNQDCIIAAIPNSEYRYKSEQEANAAWNRRTKEKGPAARER